MTVLLVVLAVFFVAVFTHPWWEAWLIRRDIKARLMDRLEEEWDREGEPIRDPDRTDW
jgi:hypothetical protein